MSNNQWVEIVAKLTLARSILASAIYDIDTAVCDIQRGDLSLSKQSAEILETMIGDLIANSDDIGEKAVYIPDVFLQLDQPLSQADSNSIDWVHFANTVSANGLNRKAS